MLKTECLPSEVRLGTSLSWMLSECVEYVGGKVDGMDLCVRDLWQRGL